MLVVVVVDRPCCDCGCVSVNEFQFSSDRIAEMLATTKRHHVEWIECESSNVMPLMFLLRFFAFGFFAVHSLVQWTLFSACFCWANLSMLDRFRECASFDNLRFLGICNGHSSSTGTSNWQALLSGKYSHEQTAGWEDSFSDFHLKSFNLEWIPQNVALELNDHVLDGKSITWLNS